MLKHNLIIGAPIICFVMVMVHVYYFKGIVIVCLLYYEIYREITALISFVLYCCTAHLSSAVK